MPSTIYGKDRKTLEALGITDEETIQLAEIRSQKEFCDKFKIPEQRLLTLWNKKIAENNLLISPKEWFKDKIKNVTAALYRQALIEGDAARVKLLYQYIDDWKEKTEQEIRSPELKEIADELKRLAIKKDDNPGSQNISP